MSNFQGQIIDPAPVEKNSSPRNLGYILAIITCLVVVASFFVGLIISNVRIDANWKNPNFNAVEVNKEFQVSTTGTSACDENATDGCVVYRFVSKYDCKQVSALAALVNSTGQDLDSVSGANSNVIRGVPFEIKFNLPANSPDIADSKLLDVRCFR